MKMMLFIFMLIGSSIVRAEYSGGDIYCDKDNQCIALNPFLSDSGVLFQIDFEHPPQIGQSLDSFPKVKWVARESDGKRYIDVIDKNGNQISAYEVKIENNERVLISVGAGAISKIGTKHTMTMTTNWGECYIDPRYC